jgi:hypothetical protein
MKLIGKRSLERPFGVIKELTPLHMFIALFNSELSKNGDFGAKFGCESGFGG